MTRLFYSVRCSRVRSLGCSVFSGSGRMTWVVSRAGCRSCSVLSEGQVRRVRFLVNRYACSVFFWFGCWVDSELLQFYCGPEEIVIILCLGFRLNSVLILDVDAVSLY